MRNGRRMEIGTRLAALALAAAIAGCTTAAKPTPPPPPAPTPEPTPVVQASAAITATAKVVKINQKTRMVTLRGPDGKDTSFRVSDDVKNLPQVKKGDDVNVTYYESVAVRVMQPGEAVRGVAVAEGVETAEPGQKPSGIGARETTITAKITAIDKAASTVTLKGPQGKLQTVKVKDPSNLDKVAVGDMIQITITEALAVSVEKPAK